MSVDLWAEVSTELGETFSGELAAWVIAAVTLSTLESGIPGNYSGWCIAEYFRWKYPKCRTSFCLQPRQRLSRVVDRSARM